MLLSTGQVSRRVQACQKVSASRGVQGLRQGCRRSGYFQSARCSARRVQPMLQAAADPSSTVLPDSPLPSLSEVQKQLPSLLPSNAQAQQLEAAKSALYLALSGLRRGASAGLEERGEVEEAQVAVEAFGGEELAWDLLPGTWELIFTTASDVVPILGAESLLSLPFLGPLVEVGLVGQRFEAQEPGFGRVVNIVQFGIKPWLQPKDGLTTLVTAKYEQRGPHTIRLQFEKAEVGQARISPLAQALLTPAILPRVQLQQALLLAIQEFTFQIQFRTAQEAAQGSGAGGGYQLTYLDEELLIGRAENSGGSFIFKRKLD